MEKGTLRVGWCVGALVLSACTSFDPVRKRETLVMHSYPEGASFTTDTGECGTTPAVVPKARGKVMHVRFEMAGYASQEVAVHSSHDGPMIGTLVLADLFKVLQPDGPRTVTAEDGAVLVAMERGTAERQAPTAPLIPSDTAPPPVSGTATDDHER